MNRNAKKSCFIKGFREPQREPQQRSSNAKNTSLPEHQAVFARLRFFFAWSVFRKRRTIAQNCGVLHTCHRCINKNPRGINVFLNRVENKTALRPFCITLRRPQKSRTTGLCPVRVYARVYAPYPALHPPPRFRRPRRGGFHASAGRPARASCSGIIDPGTRPALWPGAKTRRA